MRLLTVSAISWLALMSASQGQTAADAPAPAAQQDAQTQQSQTPAAGDAPEQTAPDAATDANKAFVPPPAYAPPEDRANNPDAPDASSPNYAPPED